MEFFPHIDGMFINNILSSPYCFLRVFLYWNYSNNWNSFCLFYKFKFIFFTSAFANKAYALLSFVSSTILIVARVFGAMIDGLDTVAITKLSAEIISTVLCLGFLWKKFFNNVSYASIPKQFSHELNVYSLQMMLTDGLWAVFMLNDLFLLGQFSGNEIAIANYKVAYVIPANLSLVTSAVGVFIAPFFTKYENKGDIIWIREKISLVLKNNGRYYGYCFQLFALF